MGQNSIRASIGKEDVISGIRLILSADFHKKRSVVVVEGEDDILFFNGKTHQDAYIEESFSGKQGVVEIVNHFSDNRVIGICDIDYDSRDICPQIFYYDNSCLEMMLISNDSAFSAFFYTYYQDNKKTPQEVRLQLLSGLKWLSLYRKLSAENNWGVKFNGISIAIAFNKNTQDIETSKLLSQISKVNPGCASSIRAHMGLLSTECRKEYNQSDYFLFTQGHDFLHYFQVYCESVRYLRGKSPGIAELFRALVCSYRKEDFAESLLFHSLSEYQTTYQLNIL